MAKHPDKSAHRFRFVLAAGLLLVLTASCTAQQGSETVSDSPGPEASASEVVGSPSVPSQEEPEYPPLPFTLDVNEAHPNSITYLDLGSRSDDPFDAFPGPCFWPVSCVRDGEQILVGYRTHGISPDRRAYIESILGDAPPAEKLTLVDVESAMFTGTQRPSCGIASIATNGDWELFPEQVVYTAYGPEDQPDEPEWTEYFQTRLSEGGVNGFSSDSPVLIADSWRFTWGGTEPVLVTATNRVLSEDVRSGGAFIVEAVPSPQAALPANASPTIYLMAALFRTGQEPLLLMENITPIETQADEYAHFYFSPADSGFWDRSFCTAQYDENGGITFYQVYGNTLVYAVVTQYRYLPECLVCDLDGDRGAELVIHFRSDSSEWGGCTVYRLSDGLPVPTYYVMS